MLTTRACNSEAVTTWRAQLGFSRYRLSQKGCADVAVAEWLRLSATDNSVRRGTRRALHMT